MTTPPILDDHAPFKPRKEPSYEEKSIMKDSVMKFYEPQMNADKRRFFVPALSSSLFLTEPNQQNNHFFAPFAYFAVKNSANHSKTALELPPNIFYDNLKVKMK